MASSTCEYSAYAFRIESKHLYKGALIIFNLTNEKTEAQRTWIPDRCHSWVSGRGGNRTIVQRASWSIVTAGDTAPKGSLSALEGSIFWGP